MKWIDNKGGQNFVNQETMKVIAVVACSFKSYFYFIFGFRNRTNFLVEIIKTFKVVGKVNALARTSPSEFMIKQSCLSLATSIPTKIMEEHFFRNRIDTVLEPQVLLAIVT